MAFFDCHFFSETLGISVSAHVLIPQAAAGEIGMPGVGARERYPVLYLLHGLSDDHTVWMRRTSVERYAAERNLAVVMPAVGRSFYQDLHAGPRYWTYLSDELPRLMRAFFPISHNREETYAAGLSMGGYGALRLALAAPDRFRAAAGLSGALDVSRAFRTAGREGSRLSKVEIEAIFGHDPIGGNADLWKLAERRARSRGPTPGLYLACGAQDSLLDENRAFRDHLTKLRISHAWSEGHGSHDWAYWDEQIQRVIDWLPMD